ncbi:hypothetical protein UT300003_32200 [Clostridium sardiniense]
MKLFSELTNKELQQIKERRIEIETRYCTEVLKNDLGKMYERFKKACKEYHLFSDPYEKLYRVIEAETITNLISKQIELKQA